MNFKEITFDVLKFLQNIEIFFSEKIYNFVHRAENFSF